MEVRKANQQIIQTEIPQKSEVNKTKSSAQNLIPDSFEKESSKSSTSNSRSAVSSEPEKKAGQITGGILIKQMTAAQLGEGFAKKELSPEQQSSVSKSDPQKENLKPSNSSQDARSRYEESKNSGLQAPFAPNKGPDANAKFSKVDKDQIIASLGQSASEQTSNAVKDADRLVDGGSIRSQVDAEVAERHQDTNAVGGSRTDRLSSLLNPTAAGPQQSGQTHGKDDLAYGQLYQRYNKDGTTSNVKDTATNTANGIVTTHAEGTKQKDGTYIFESQTTEYRQFSTKVETHTKKHDDADNKLIEESTTVTTTQENGQVTVVTTTKTRNKDGSYTTTTTPDPTKTAGGGTKSYDQENYTGNIPDELKKTMDYFKQQAIAQKPQSGGETAHTDDSAAADPTVGGRVSNLVVQQGNLGLFGNPGSTTSQTGPSGGGQVGSGQSGGNVDFGPDSDQVGYTGPTHQDDPADVQFGPADQPKEQASKKTEDSNDSSSSVFDSLNRKKAK